MWEQSDVVLAFAAALVGPLCLQPLQERAAAGGNSSSSASSESLVSLLFDVHLARYVTAARPDHQVSRLPHLPICLQQPRRSHELCAN